jgi:hypothetical protein
LKKLNSDNQQINKSPNHQITVPSLLLAGVVCEASQDVFQLLKRAAVAGPIAFLETILGFVEL